MSISKFFWVFLFAMLGISSVIRRDNDFWLFILLVSAGMLTIIAMGKWLKEDLKEEWKSLEGTNAEWDRLIEPEKWQSLEEELEVRLRKERESLEEEFEIRLRKERESLEEEKKKFEQKNKFSSISKFNSQIFFDEIMEMKDTEKSSQIKCLNTTADKIRDEIRKEISNENKYYKQAFSRFFKQFPDELKKLRTKYDPDNYRSSSKWRNEKWATKRVYQIDDILDKK